MGLPLVTLIRDTVTRLALRHPRAPERICTRARSNALLTNLVALDIGHHSSENGIHSMYYAKVSPNRQH